MPRKQIFRVTHFCFTPMDRDPRAPDSRGDVACDCDAGSPGSGGASPYLCLVSRLALPDNVNPKDSRSDYYNPVPKPCAIHPDPSFRATSECESWNLRVLSVFSKQTIDENHPQG
jgi:hypothetical protein